MVSVSAALGHASPIHLGNPGSKATSLLYIKYPEHGPFRAFEHNETLIYRVTPKVISVIDYIKGFGHTELITVDADD